MRMFACRWRIASHRDSKRSRRHHSHAVPAAYATAAAIQLGSPNTCNNYAAAAYISALTNAIAISNTEAAAQAIYAAFTLGW
jgi:hypothetical protein